MKFVFHKKYKLYIKFLQKIFIYAFNTIMKLFFTIVYIRIISLRWKFDDHPLVEYPLYNIIWKAITYTNDTCLTFNIFKELKGN